MYNHVRFCFRVTVTHPALLAARFFRNRSFTPLHATDPFLAIRLLPSLQAAVLTGGHVVVHPISVEAGHAPDELDVVIPGPGQPANITCVALTPTFVITGSRTGTLSYYLSPDVTPVNEFRHDDG